jgi:hypothetical protein
MKDVPCAYCDASVLASAFVLCGKCEVPVHKDCWAEAQKCPTYGCAATESLDPALALFRRAAPRSQAVAVPAPAPAPQPATHLESALGHAVQVVESVVSSIAVGLMGGEVTPPRPAAAPAAPPAQSALAVPPATELAPREAEIARVEAELHSIRVRNWLRTLLLFTWVVMFPPLTKLISKNFIFVWLAVLMGISTWPDANGKSNKAREKQLTKRLAELEAQELPAR